MPSCPWKIPPKGRWSHARHHVHDGARDLRRDQAADPAEPAVQRGDAPGRAQGVLARAIARAVRAVARAQPARGDARGRREQRRGGPPRRGGTRRSRDRRRECRAIYGLTVLCPHIEDESNNTTRFWVLGRQQVPASGRDETSLVMSAPNRPGAVHDLLEPLARHGVSMTRFESRPARTGLWEIPVLRRHRGTPHDPPVAAALAELARRAPFLSSSAPIRLPPDHHGPIRPRRARARLRTAHRALRPRQAGRGARRELGLDPATIVKLASNENPAGPVRRCARHCDGDRGAHALPRRQCFALKAALAARLGVPAARSCSATAATTSGARLARVPRAGGRGRVLPAPRSRSTRWPRRRAAPRHRGAGADHGTTSGDARRPSARARASCSSPTRTTRRAPGSRRRTCTRS